MLFFFLEQQQRIIIQAFGGGGQYLTPKANKRHKKHTSYCGTNQSVNTDGGWTLFTGAFLSGPSATRIKRLPPIIPSLLAVISAIRTRRSRGLKGPEARRLGAN